MRGRMDSPDPGTDATVSACREYGCAGPRLQETDDMSWLAENWVWVLLGGGFILASGGR